MTTTASRSSLDIETLTSTLQEIRGLQDIQEDSEACDPTLASACRRLPRQGKPDLLFTGALLGKAQEHEGPDPAERNWWEIALYKTSVGAYLLASTFHVVEGGNRPLCTVISFCKAERLREFFELHAAPVSEMAQSILLQAAARDLALRRVFAASPTMLRGEAAP